MSEIFSDLVVRWVEFMNDDQELKRRLNGFKKFSGVPGFRAERARVLGWPRAMGTGPYPHGGQSHLDGKEIVELSVPGIFNYTIVLKNKKFSFNEKKAKDPVLGIEMPLQLMKETLLSKQRWVWAIADPSAKITYMEGIPHSDWVTIFEVLVCFQELSDFHPELKKVVEAL